MSVQAMTAVFQRSKATGNARLVMLGLADHADDYGICWPGIETVAAKVLADPRTVQRAVQRQKAKGELVIIPREGQTNAYVLTVPGLKPWDHEAEERLNRLTGGRQNDTPVIPGRGDTSATPTPDTGDTPGATPAPPEPKGNPHTEPPPGAEAPSRPERKPRARDPIWDALVAEHLPEPTTKSERGRWNAAVKQLKDIGATAGEVRARCRIYRQKWRNVDLTPTALAANWSLLEPPRRQEPHRAPEKGHPEKIVLTDADRAAKEKFFEELKGVANGMSA